MKKLIQAIKTFFQKIWSIIDRFIVFPLTKLVLKISTYFEQSSRKIENWLSQADTLLFISLFIAIVAFIVVDQKILGFSQSSAEVLKNQPI